jgi:hypothetical protein
MSELKLVSQQPGSIGPLVENAIIGSLRDTEQGIQITQKRLQAFEQKYQMTTEVFIQRYENDELEETLDLAEWIGEHRMLKGLQEDAAQLRGIRIELVA